MVSMADFERRIYRSIVLDLFRYGVVGQVVASLADVEEQTQERMEALIQQMKEVEEVTEELKARNQMEWVENEQYSQPGRGDCASRNSI